uniref:Chromo domain-containing protein n=1 Tax=Pygocentrus nattereri TaxID=42514 RepID=A0AAR2JZP4_PYGNA
MVWLCTKDLRLKLPCKKLTPRFIGPLRILRQITPVSYKLELPRSYRIATTFHVSFLKPVHASQALSDVAEPPPPFEVDGSLAYAVHSLLDSRRCGGRLQYLVDWEGYGPEERSWVATEDLLDPSLISDFHRDQPDRPAPWPRGRPSHRSSLASRAAPQFLTLYNCLFNQLNCMW